MLLLNKIWVLQSQMTNYLLAQQKLVSKVREGAKEDTLAGLNPAAIQRQIQALTGELLATATSKAAATSRPPVTSRAEREPAQQAAS